MPKAQPQVSESAHQDANQNYSLIAVQGTLGTADISGTAPTVALGANALTGALYVQDLSGASGTTTIAGSVVVTAGTINTGTFTNLGSNVNVVTGTQNTLGTVGVINNGTLAQVTSVSNVVGGTIFTGTFVNNGGSVQVNPTPNITGTYANTIGTTAAAVWGTLVASVGNGLKVYVTGVDVVVQTGTVDVAITNNVAGSTGTGVYTRGQFIQGGGIAKSFSPTLATGTGGTIAYWLGGAGTVSMNLQYFVAA